MGHCLKLCGFASIKLIQPFEQGSSALHIDREHLHALEHRVKAVDPLLHLAVGFDRVANLQRLQQFQDLTTNKMAWWDETITTDGKKQLKTVGKQPAWLDYMTNYNKVFGNFAIEDNEMFMTLNRKYEMDENSSIADLTTYIDPEKYNYIFADTSLDAMNFGYN